MKKLSLFLTLTFFVSGVFAQKTGSFTDSRDGKTYKTVTIGKQVWMAENLAYKAGSGCWAYDARQYGYLYNWETAKKVCPNGWHLPSDAEWKKLTDYLGGAMSAGGKLKETGTKHWKSPNEGATDEAGFSALPGGIHTKDGSFYNVGSHGVWWSSTQCYVGYPYYRSLSNDNDYMNRTFSPNSDGYSVRCIKD